MYAVIKIAGKQHRVEQGRWFLIEQAQGKELAAEVLLVSDGTKVQTGAAAAKATVKLSEAGTVRIRGNRSMKFRPKQGRTSKRMLGYRRTMLKVNCDSISV